MKNKRVVSISLQNELLDFLNKKRNNIPLSKFIEEALIEKFERELIEDG